MVQFTSQNVLESVSSHAVLVVIAALTAYTLYGVIWRLFLSPIAAFPGPKLAALTRWYEFYYDVYPHYGRMTWKLAELHEKYGPIVRLSPYELHISTPDFYDTLYSATKKRDKYAWFFIPFGLKGAAWSTIDHHKHRERRAALNPFFSLANVRKLQPIIAEKVQKNLERLRELKASGDVVRVVIMGNAFAQDVVMQYSFGRTNNLLESPDFGQQSFEVRRAGGVTMTTLRHNIWIFWIMTLLPDSITSKIGAMAEMFEQRRIFQKQVRATFKEKAAGVKKTGYQTVFDDLIDGSNKRGTEDRSVERLAEEANVIVTAGEDTTGQSITQAVYRLLENPAILRKLKAELAEAIPDLSVETPLTTLQNLPYLTGFIKESLRLSYGVASRLQRLPHEPLVFSTPTKDWVIPAFTPVGMTSVLLHHNETTFPESWTFKPERWIDDPQLDKYLVSFSKGTRMCVGMHLAYAELYLWIAAVFRRFGSAEVRFPGDEGILELVDTTFADVKIVADRFNPLIEAGRKGVQIRVRE